MNDHTTTYVASIPLCDICGVVAAKVDGKTVMGPWAYMCGPCWDIHGIGALGLGKGQVLTKRSAS